MIVLSLLFIAISAAIALYDFLYFKIPNVAILILVGIFLLKWSLFDPTTFASYPLIIFGGALILGFCLFALRVVGAGDAKYFAVASLWTSTIDFSFFLLVMSVAGGILGYLYLRCQPTIQKIRKGTEKILKTTLGKRLFTLFLGTYARSPIKLNASRSASKIMPYGIAISAASIISTIIDIMR